MPPLRTMSAFRSRRNLPSGIRASEEERSRMSLITEKTISISSGHHATCVDITHAEFDQLRRQFGTEMQFVDMHRRYHTLDGDAQDYHFDGDWTKARTLSESHHYQNKVQASRSIFKFENISNSRADSLSLFHYPDIIDDDQTPFLGYTPDSQTEKRFRWINARYGKQYQFRIYLLFYRNKNVNIVEHQRSYWQGVNKNEMAVCIGIDDSDHVQWCECLSWSDTPRLESKTRQFFLESDSLRLMDYANHLVKWVPHDWHRKSFKDFDYLTIELSDTQYWLIIILTLIYNVGMSVWVVRNEYAPSPDLSPKGEE